MSNFRDGYLQQGQALGQDTYAFTLDADNLVIPVRAPLIKLYSDDTTAANRTFTLDPTTCLIGQQITLVLYSGASTTCQFLDAGSAVLSGVWTPLQYDTLQLFFDGSLFIETGRKAESSEFNTIIVNPVDGDLVVYDATAELWFNQTMSGAITMDENGVTTLVSTALPLDDGKILVGDVMNTAAEVLMSGDVTLSNAGVASIGAGVIVAADINAAAAIEFSKMEPLAPAEMIVGSAGSVPTAVALTGDVTVSDTGVTSITAASIVLADINRSVMAEATGTLSQAQILALDITPVTAIAAPGAGFEILVQDVEIQHVYSTAVYAGAGVLDLEYASGDAACSFVAGVVTGATSQSYINLPNSGATPVVVTSAENSVLRWSNTGAAFVLGDVANVINYRIRYRIVSTTF